MELPIRYLLKVNGTLPETNIAPENEWLEDEISSWEGLFPGAMLVSGPCEFMQRAIVLQGVLHICNVA